MIPRSPHPLSRMPLSMRVGLVLWDLSGPATVVALVLAVALFVGIIFLTWGP